MNTIFIYLMSPAAGVFNSLQAGPLSPLFDAQSYVWWDNPDNNMNSLIYKYVFCKDPTSVFK
jgi:hypothetical protein